jgi:hypothetical protein
MHAHKQLTTILILLLISAITICPVYANTNNDSNNGESPKPVDISIYTNHKTQSTMWIIQNQNTNSNPYDITTSEIQPQNNENTPYNIKTYSIVSEGTIPKNLITPYTTEINTNIPSTSSSPIPILPLDPEKNTLESFETEYTDIGSIHSKIIHEAEGFKNPPQFQQHPTITTLKQSINKLKSNGFTVHEAKYETLDTTKTYNEIKNAIDEQSQSQTTNPKKVYASTNTYLLYNKKTNEDAIIIQYYLSNNKQIIGKPLITQTTLNQIVQYNNPPTHSSETPTYFKKSDIDHKNLFQVSEYTTSTTNNQQSIKSIKYPQKFHFEPATHYLSAAIKIISIIVIIVAIVILIKTGGIIIVLAKIAESFTQSILAAGTIMYITSQFTEDCHEYYPIDTYKTYIDTIAIATTHTNKYHLPVNEKSDIILEQTGAITIKTKQTSGDKFLHFETTPNYIRHFENSNKTHPYTVYKIPVTIVIPKNSYIYKSENEKTVSIIKNNELIANIIKKPGVDVNIVFETESEYTPKFIKSKHYTEKTCQIDDSAYYKTTPNRETILDYIFTQSPQLIDNPNSKIYLNIKNNGYFLNREVIAYSRELTEDEITKYQNTTTIPTLESIETNLQALQNDDIIIQTNNEIGVFINIQNFKKLEPRISTNFKWISTYNYNADDSYWFTPSNGWVDTIYELQ